MGRVHQNCFVILVRLLQKFVSQFFGEVAEWLKAAVLKTVIAREGYLEFESLPLRLFYTNNQKIRLFRYNVENEKAFFVCH